MQDENVARLPPLGGFTIDHRARNRFFGTLRSGDCYIEFGKPVSIGQPVVGSFRVVSGSTLVTGTFNVTP
jgi:hypothetical protein